MVALMKKQQGRISRRAVTAGLTAGLGAAALPRGLAARNPRQIVVIGAGLAGLGAAQVLQAAGHRVRVIEARGRIGGRIWTQREWPDLPVDMGASWIHGARGNPLTDLARGAGARLLATSYDAALLLGPDGAPIDPDLRPAARILNAALAQAEDRDSDQSIADALAAYDGWRTAPPAQRRLVQYLVNSTLEQEFSGSAQRLSAWYGQEAQEFDGEDLLFPQGFDQITTDLARGLDVQLSRPVSAIAPGRVDLADGTQLAADAVLCTLPLGVLQGGQVRLAQPLAPARRRAIDRLGMGVLNKCWLRFDRVAWPDDVDWIGWLGDAQGAWGEWVSLARVMGAPVLLGFHAGDSAVALSARSDAETVAAAHAALRAMFGSAFPAPRAAQITRWDRDPFARGSYSFHAVGSSPADRRALAGADWGGQLWFAGEAAQPAYYGTAHGALMSGRQVAAQMRDAL